jgi:outer membrane protein TolC
MPRPYWPSRLLPSRPSRKLLLPLFLLVSAGLAPARPLAAAQLPLADSTPQPAAQQQPPVQAGPVVALNLGDCIQMALQRQPRLAAARASLAAAQDGARALDNLNAPGLLAPELPIRRRQAGLGVTAAAAAVDQAERETVYAVTYNYFTVIYAREQEAVARDIVERLGAVRKTAKDQLEGGAREVTEADVKKSTAYVHLAEAKRIQASQGVRRATAALREAIGLCADDALIVAPGTLFEAPVRPSCHEVVAAALARRGELVRTGVFAEVACLEAEAQGTGMHKKMETFAAGADIHAVVVPPGAMSPDYRPGALQPEFPTLLAGCRPDRVRRAQDFHARAQAVVAVSRNLIALEAEDAYLRWEEAAQQIGEGRVAAENADAAANQLSKALTNKLVKVDEALSGRVLAAQARSQYNEYLYRQLVALADLERITGGAFCARLVEGTTVAPVGEVKGQK